VGGRYYGVRRNKVVGLAEIVGVQKYKTQEGAQHNDKPHHVLARVVSMERNFIGIAVDPEGVIPARRMQEENV